MTDLRTAAQQALEALEEWHGAYPHRVEEDDIEVAEALRAALAEPVQEPVAWRWGYRSITTGEMDWRGYVEIAADPNLRSPEIVMQPLYTSPPQRKPLTEEEISNIWDGHVVPVFGKNGINPIVFARAIERAHGVGEQP